MSNFLGRVLLEVFILFTIRGSLSLSRAWFSYQRHGWAIPRGADPGGWELSRWINVCGCVSEKRLALFVSSFSCDDGGAIGKGKTPHSIGDLMEGCGASLSTCTIFLTASLLSV